MTAGSESNATTALQVGAFACDAELRFLRWDDAVRTLLAVGSKAKARGYALHQFVGDAVERAQALAIGESAEFYWAAPRNLAPKCFVVVRRTEDRWDGIVRQASQLEMRAARHADKSLALRTLFDLLPHPVFVTDPDGRFLLANQACARSLGTPLDELPRLAITDFYVDEKESAAMLAEDRQVLASGEVSVQDAVSRRDVHGGERWVQTVKTPYRGSGVNGDAVLTVEIDVSAMKQLQAQLRRSQKLEAMGLLSGSIAHDFNNLLAAIDASCFLLDEELGGHADLLELVSDISAASERGADLTQKLLAFGRKQSAKPVTLELNGVLHEVSTLIGRLLGSRVQLSFALSAEPLWIHIDRGQLEQALLNLAANAKDAMPKGGMFEITTSVLESTDDEPRQIEILVRDTGVGMDERTKAKLFEPFFTTKTEGKGTGLGLSTVYGCVMEAGGAIEVESELGHGTSFVLHFPERFVDMTIHKNVIELPRGNGERILVVDDDARLRHQTSAVLLSFGYEVVVASDGLDALSHMENEVLDMVLCDMVMPRLGGVGFLRRLQERANTDASRAIPPIVLTSGYSREALAQRGVVDESFDILEKPYAPSELLRRVRQCLDYGRVSAIPDLVDLD